MTQNNLKEIVVVMRGPSTVAFRNDQSLRTTELLTAIGPVNVVIATRWLKREGYKMPGNLWIEITGKAPTLEEALVPFANAGLNLLPTLSLSANAGIGLIDIEIGFDNTPGATERDYFQNYIPEERNDLHTGRFIKLDATRALFQAIGKNSETERLGRATTQYRLALDYWRMGQESLALSHLRGKVSRSTLADANEKRDWRIFSDFAQVLIHETRQLYVDDDFGLELKETVYALDASTIDLCLSVFPWAQFRKSKGAVKLHTLLDLRGDIPTFIWITDGKVHDVNVLDHLVPEPGSIYIMDRAYLDFKRLYELHQCSAIFVTRTKTNTKLRRIYSNKVDKSIGVRCDQTVVLKGFYSRKDYPEKLRRVKFFDADKGRSIVFLTNQFTLPAHTIAELYRYRWRVENFFKWIKQHLRIKSFYGTSQNAVRTQIWIAMSTYVLVAIMKKRLRIDLTLYTILQILSITLFEKMPILQALTADGYRKQITSGHMQLKLFNS